MVISYHKELTARNLRTGGNSRANDAYAVPKKAAKITPTIGSSRPVILKAEWNAPASTVHMKPSFGQRLRLVSVFIFDSH